MGDSTSDAATVIEQALADAGVSYDNLTQTVARNATEQTTLVQGASDKVKYFSDLNAEHVQIGLDKEREAFQKWLEDGRVIREKRQEEEARTNKAINDSWTTFKNNQDVTMQALKESNISFTDLVEELAIRHDTSVSQMADRLAMDGIRMGDTWGLIQQQGKSSMDGLISEIESASQTVAEKMADMGRVMSGTSFTDAGGRSLGLGEGGMKGFTGMSSGEQMEGMKSGTLSASNLAGVASAATAGGGSNFALANAALDQIAAQYEGDADRIAAETALFEGGFGKHDTGVRLTARNRINDHLRMLQKHTRMKDGVEIQPYAHLKQLSRSMIDDSWAQSQAIETARQLAPQVGGKQGELLRLYASGGITAFAGGGIVTRPTLGLVGEAGPEAIVPLGRGGGMGTTNNFHFHGAVYGVEDLKEAVVEAVRDHAISGGFSGVFAEA